MFWRTPCYEFGPFRVDARERRLFRNDEVVPLTPKVFDLLLVLVQNHGHILTKDEMLRLVWPDTEVEEGNVSRNISTLRSALGERPNEHQYIETAPWRGYRFVANVKEVFADVGGMSASSLAVLPFINATHDPELEYVSDGITESLINKFSHFAQLKVMSRNSVFRYKGREIAASIVGHELNVHAVMSGRLAKYGDRLSISVELVDARDDSHIWGSQYIRNPSDILTMPERIAQEITDKLRLRLTGEQQQRLARHQTQRAEAYQHYLKGRYLFNKLTPEGVQKGIEHFKQAIEIDPAYAMAHVGLGDCCNYLAKPVEARHAMTKALEIDETLGEAHASLGFFKFVYDWDFPGAEREFSVSLKLNPNYAEAHHWSSIYFANMGRHGEADVEAKLSVELDPLSLLMNVTPGLTAYLARDYERATAHLLQVIELDNGFPAAHSVLGNTYLQQGFYDEAIAEYQKVLSLCGDFRSVKLSVAALLGQAYAKLGDRNKALNILDELIKASEENDQQISLHSIAEIHVALGKIDEAFEWLNKAFDQHDMQMVSLRVNPTLDPLRNDSRFADLLKRMRL